MVNLGLASRHRWQLRLHNVMAALGLDGLKRVSLAALPLNDERVFELQVNGETMLLPAALIWRSYRRGIPARRERLAREFGLGAPFQVGAGDTVIDIGANMGDFALSAAAKGASVFAFDGDPLVVNCLSENVKDVPAISVVQAILWKADEEVTFYSAPERADSSLFLPPGEGVASFSANAKTLDTLAAEHGIDQVALLKMDAEGAEPEVLQGGMKLLERTKAVAIDTGPERNGEETHDTCAEILRQSGFEVMPRDLGERRKITMARRA